MNTVSLVLPLAIVSGDKPFRVAAATCLDSAAAEIERYPRQDSAAIVPCPPSGDRARVFVEFLPSGPTVTEPEHRS